MTLYRASNYASTNSDTTSFAARRADAAAYLNNPGYGGATLWRTEVEIVDSEVLDITDGAPEWLRDLVERHGAIGIEEAIGAISKVSDGIAARGFRWVRLIDSYPDDCETWILIGDMDLDMEVA